MSTRDKDAPEEGAFLGRWSRLKRERAAEEASVREAPVPVEEPAPEAEDERLEDLTDEEALGRLGLPDPDTLHKGDDFSGFMAKTVPERLRNRALRRLWISDPVLANVDELVDYGEDFTDAARVVENLQTAYRVGRGFLDDEDEDEVETEGAEEAAGEADAEAAAAEPAGEGEDAGVSEEDGEAPVASSHDRTGDARDGGDATDSKGAEMVSGGTDGAREGREEPVAAVRFGEKQPQIARRARMKFHQAD